MVDQIQAQFRILEKNERLIKEREELIIDAIESIPDAFGLFDAEDKLILCNQAYVKTFTLFDSFAEIKGTSFEDLVRSSLKFKGEVIDPNFEGDEEAWVARRAYHHRNPSDQGLVLQFASGKWLQVMERKTQSGGIVGIRTDVTSIKEAQNNIEKYAFYDSLTNLANRRLMLEKLEFARKAVVNNRGMCSVLIIDIDHFKMVNDTRGHDFGDKVLIAFAERMVKTIRKTDVASRLGGDEFLVLLNDLSASYPSALKEVHAIVDHLHKKLSEPYIIDNKSYSITPSIGATFFSGTTNTINDLLKEADLALYEAKKSGRNTIQFFDKTIYDEFMDHINTENMVRNAISNQMFVLHFQYVFNEARQVVGAETLLRLKDENDSLPDKLITIAEETGLIVPLGMWVIQSAFKQMVLWQEKLKIDQFYLSINISPRQFLDPNFLSDLETKLNQSGVNPNQICLELTENLFMLDIDKILGKIDVIKKLGFKLSIDDFGMKYSSLNYLKILPVDKIKIDKSFVKELAISKGDETIVKSILFLGQNFGFEVTAEGVENYSQFETLKAMGCQYFQGYFFHKPSLPDAIELDELTKGLQV
jgi:diguanylate cyclase (GGDEF)-like protein